MPQPHAVFIGSSNATPNTWVNNFSSRMGYQSHIYSVGGGSFTGQGPGRFENQLSAAIADTSYDKSLVEYFFLCDVSNDIRATANVQLEAQGVFSRASSAYPNARIIVLPAVWGNAARNNSGNVLNSISLRYQELVNASLNFDRVELINHSWTWLADGGDWMESTAGGASGVHPNPAGYKRVEDFMVKYIRGADVSYNQGIKGVTPSANINPYNSYWTAGRAGNIVTLTENFRINAVGVDTDLGQLEYGLWPIQNIVVPVVVDTSRTVSGAIVIFTTGLIRSYGALPAGSHNVHVSYRSF